MVRTTHIAFRLTGLLFWNWVLCHFYFLRACYRDTRPVSHKNYLLLLARGVSRQPKEYSKSQTDCKGAKETSRASEKSVFLENFVIIGQPEKQGDHKGRALQGQKHDFL
jgi:hypothetical protein